MKHRSAVEGHDAASNVTASAVARLFARALATAGRSLADLALPPLCLACEARILAHDNLCPDCWKGIDFITAPLCDRLGLPLPFDTGGIMVSAAADAEPPAYGRARAVARYEGPLRHLIHDFKFHDSHNARRLFGRWLHTAGLEILVGADLIVPVPLARSRLLSRRFNQAQLLAAEVAALSHIAVAPMALVRSRSTRQQIGLTRLQRRQNIAGAFSVSKTGATVISGRSIVLIDDVITTGATISAASKALLKGGASRVDVLALAMVCDTGR